LKNSSGRKPGVGEGNTEERYVIRTQSHSWVPQPLRSIEEKKKEKYPGFFLAPTPQFPTDSTYL